MSGAWDRHEVAAAVIEHEREHGVEVDERAVLRYVDIALTEVEIRMESEKAQAKVRRLVEKVMSRRTGSFL